MNKRVIIIHGLSGSPESDFLPWAKEELEKMGYEVIIPSMPNPGHARMEEWIPFLQQIIGQSQETDILIGHSVGCQTILRFLETLPENQGVDQVILIAGWFILTNLDEEESSVLRSWMDAPLNFDKIKQHANKFTVILSDNDPYVPLEENRKVFEQKLGAKTIVEQNKGHFNAMPEERPDSLLDLFTKK